MGNNDMFKEMIRIQREMDHLFQTHFREAEHPLIESKTVAPLHGEFRVPLCHFEETNNAFFLNFELPGTKPEDIQLDLNNKEVEIRVQSKTKQEQTNTKAGNYQFGSYASNFYRKIPLYQDIDTEKIKTKYENGILQLELPKLDVTTQKKRIHIT